MDAAEPLRWSHDHARRRGTRSLADVGNAFLGRPPGIYRDERRIVAGRTEVVWREAWRDAGWTQTATIQSLCRLLQQHFDWDAHYFLPDDEIAVIMWDPSTDLRYVHFANECEELLGIDINDCASVNRETATLRELATEIESLSARSAQAPPSAAGSLTVLLLLATAIISMVAGRQLHRARSPDGLIELVDFLLLVVTGVTILVAVIAIVDRNARRRRWRRVFVALLACAVVPLATGVAFGWLGL